MEIELESNQNQILKNLTDSIRESLEGNLFGDVMVLGGGVSGVQASLDLAASGFKVYLVDKAPAIGGHMAQLDKTFPTNDCSI
jgi:heterodisulfide reductase subunit A